MQTLWGIDLGGTKIEGVVVQADKFSRVLARQRIPTESAQGYQHIVSQIVKLVRMLEEATNSKPTTIGIGTPGTLDPGTQTLKNSNTVCLNGMPLRHDLEAALGIPVQMANDANCFALAEATMGVCSELSKSPEVVFGVILGTGVGGGLVVNNKVLGGRHGIAGEWGHNVLDDVEGEPCYCGKMGCVETILSGPALQRYYARLSGNNLPMKDILKRYEAGEDIHAASTIKRMLYYFGKAIAVVINITDPDVIVLGGGLGNIDLLYTEGAREIEKWVFNPRVETLLLKPKLGDSAGVFGAASLVADGKPLRAITLS